MRERGVDRRQADKECRKRSGEAKDFPQPNSYPSFRHPLSQIIILSYHSLGVEGANPKGKKEIWESREMS